MLCLTCEESLRTALLDAINSQRPFDYRTSRLSGLRPRDEKDFAKSNRKYVLQDKPKDVFRGCEAGCFLCGSILTHEGVRSGLRNALISNSSSNSFPIEVEVCLFTDSPPHLDVFAPIQSDRFMEFTLCPTSAQESKGIYNSLPGKTVEISACTSRATRIWRYWYDTCTKSHTECQRAQTGLSRFTPSRLIKILEPESTESRDLRWRLVLGNTIPDVPYVTLSHCWGTSQHTVLTNANLEVLKNISDCASLPKTYQDAMIIAHSLGFRHIWIDSLCIIQDNQADWLRESSNMDKVYKTSSCNIAATWARDGTGGCFSESDPALTSLTTVSITSSSGEMAEYQIGNADAKQGDIEAAALNTRAWVFQERYLSPRQIQFAASQVYWECHELVASEQFPAGLPSDMCGSRSSKRVLDNRGDQIELRRKWDWMVREYSETKVTRVSDRTIAFSGLVGYMRSYIEDEYLAGLWRQDLSRQLLWFPRRGHLLRQRTASNGAYLAPSWSWMSVNTPIVYDFRYAWEEVMTFQVRVLPVGIGRPDVQNHHIDCIEIVHAAVQSEHESKLHSFSSGQLLIQGIGLWGYDTGFSCDPGCLSLGPIAHGEIRRYQFQACRGMPCVDDIAPASNIVGSRPSGDDSFDQYTGRAFPSDGGDPSRQNFSGGQGPRGLLLESFSSGNTETIGILWDTSTASPPSPSEVSDSFLFLIVDIKWDMTSDRLSNVKGLVLKEVGGEKKGIFTREGIFTSVSPHPRASAQEKASSRPLNNLATRLWQRATDEDRKLRRLSFGDPEVAKLLQTVTII